MKGCSGIAAVVVGAVANFLLANAAMAAPMAFVASTGDDTNPCTRAQPCKTLVRAAFVVDALGEVNCLDSGPFEFGGFTFSKSTTIDCAGLHVIDLANFGAFQLNGHVVKIRNLTISGVSGGWPAVRILGGGTLIIENCVFENFKASGARAIDITLSGGSFSLIMTNSRVSNSTAGNILIRPTDNATVSAVFDRVTVTQSTFGIKADGSGQSGGQIDVEVRDSIVAHHSTNGFISVSDAGQAPIHFKVTRSSAANNMAFGAVASGAQAFMILGGTTLTKNGTGLAQLNGATVASYGNNEINFNTTNTSGTITLIGLK